MSTPIRISTSDLHTPDVDSYVEMQSYLRRDVGPMSDQPWLVRVIYANWFYLAVCSMIGGLVGWAFFEPWFDDNELDERCESVQPVRVSGRRCDDRLVSGCGGGNHLPQSGASAELRRGRAGDRFCRRTDRLDSDRLCYFGVMTRIALSLWDDPQPDAMPTGLALLVFMMGRAAAWSIAAIPAGMGQGIALRERKVILNGVVGAVLGGLVGGLLFDPISYVADDRRRPGHVQPGRRLRRDRLLCRPVRRPRRRLDEDGLAADAKRSAGRQAIHPLPRYHGAGQLAEGGRLSVQR